eukprot:9490250-Pyramimonas_sp.AAC.1
MLLHSVHKSLESARLGCAHATDKIHRCREQRYRQDSQDEGGPYDSTAPPTSCRPDSSSRRSRSCR